MPPFSEHLHSLGNCNIRLAFETGGRLPAKRSRPLVVVKRFKESAYFLPNAPQKQFGVKIERYLHSFSIYVSGKSRQHDNKNGAAQQKKSPLQITWGGDRLKYHYDINIYEN